ncbi:MAG: hypothetical protein K9K38_18990 [Rhodoferax sp.]|nr:hypothetical protein [Rhodoferax sp.]MCF8211465.1 hypothetical protein [Rhodoferax sp.]
MKTAIQAIGCDFSILKKLLLVNAIIFVTTQVLVKFNDPVRTELVEVLDADRQGFDKLSPNGVKF